MIFWAEQGCRVRIRPCLPHEGFGQRYDQITAWLDENCGADGWAMTPSGMRGVLNDAVSIYFLDATLASAFRRPMVRRVQGRDGWRRVQNSRQRAGAAYRGSAPSETVRSAYNPGLS